ncbi:Feruloyl esterase B [Fulvia fulva]|uniref:feruloyl esterase n=1 Tax=Passalora fulva TaxID=5499 RepID=A0A9Q8LCM2_PASFU|nr:Feruloyl esterase B [Fulvia fulva]KAK4629608.1 Feruloyl esterase B [Fulvia fulva]UJO14754.1 Feruloyl esterase B [Fulvia fulva]WPV12069.1 Feruloyl esterase B [Fulvia fulva]WPV27319.1 Feruloyl esterase B [Fulvia fulva]
MAAAPGVFAFPQDTYTTSLNTLANILAPAAKSAGCGADLPKDLTPGGSSVNITIQSPLSPPNTTVHQREYLIHIPESYPESNDNPRPLVPTFNGQYHWTESIERYTGFSTSAFNPHSIAVYPAGVGNQWLGDVLAPNSSYINDIQFVSDVLDDLESKLCIDKNRIYAAGLSNGGGMTGLLACNGTVGGRFAALAGVAAAYYPDKSLPEHLFGEKCGLDRDEGSQIPYLEIHGTEDQVVRYNGSNTPDPDTYNIPTFLSKIAKLNGCAADAEQKSGLNRLETNSTQTLNGGNVTKHS